MRQTQAAVEDDRHGRAAFQARQAAGEFRVVGQRRSRPHHDRIMGGAELVAAGAGVGAGDPFALATQGRDLAVEGGGKLQGNERPAGDKNQPFDSFTLSVGTPEYLVGCAIEAYVLMSNTNVAV